MKKSFSRAMAFVIAFVMLLGVLPISAFAAEEKPMTITVSSQTGCPGDTVQVKVVLDHNVGLTGLQLSISYDSEVLSLTNVEVNSDFGGAMIETSKPYKNPQSLTMISPLAENTTNGTLATLSFTIAEDAPNNYDTNIVVTPLEVYNESGDIALAVINGSITVYHGLPGDINEDSKVDTKDAIQLFRYVAGWDVDVDTAALDVNSDNKITTKDAVTLFRYVAGWEDIILYYGEICTHDLIHSVAKEPTCTEDGQIEFWYCELCGRIYSDEDCNTQISRQETIVSATGHNTVIDDAVEATHTSTGLTQGSHCDVCGTVLVEQQVIPVIPGTNYGIAYDLFGGDTYLATVGVANNNPTTYVSEVGLQLEDLSSPGYVFKGWKTSDGTQISEITANTTGNKTLYAQWEKVVYTINFDSPDVPVESMTYTIDTGATLISPSWYGYTFVGWSNDDGFIVSRIKEGTTGNITLHANWTSNRNRATSYSSYEKPIIIEDSSTGQFLFVYNIGRIDNVPLYQIGYIGNTQKLDMTVSFTYTDTITSEQAELIANSISNATTRSSGWTLSEEWNQIYVAEEESQNSQVKSEERTDSEGNTVGGNYFVSNSSGGSTYVSNESGGSSSSSSKVTTDKSVGINQSYDTSKNTYVDGKLSVQNTHEVSAGVSLPVKVVDVSAGVKNTTTVGAEVAAGRKDNEAYHVDGSASSYVGTVNTSNSSSYHTTIKNNSNSWNSEEGYEKSHEISTNTQIAEAISSQISKKTSYHLTDALGGQNSKTSSIDEEEIKSNEYQTSLKYSSGTSQTETKTYEYHVDAEGYYRVVMAGTIHVYGVVGYDVATGSYYTYTFSVLDDERHEYLDYSKDNANFTDCENGVVTFEIPYEVNEYIVGVTGRTDGVEVNLDGTITGFEAPEHFDGTVSIPQYYSVNNGDNTYTAYQTKAIDANAFRGNTSIKTVILPIYITEIPDNAFEGCTNLETVIAYGVTKIGNNAFKGCTSLTMFAIDSLVTSIGANAFEDCPEIRAMAANSSVAEAILNSGAKKITLDLTKLSDYFDNRKITVSDSTEYFALFGGGKTFTNLQIESNAAETFISNITFVGNTDTPIKLSSNTIALGRVTVEDAPGFALIVESANAEVKLLGNINLSTKSTNTVISKNVTFSKADSGVAGYMNVTGKYLVCGAITNDSMLTASNGVEQIDEDIFNSMLTSSTVTFNANGGSASESSKTVYYGQYYGVLPTPTRANYTFTGWYTEAEGGTRITADSIVIALVNQTLYAHWAPNPFTVHFDANGGSVSPSSKALTFGNSLGSLPTPTRANYTFAGWHDANGNRVYDSTVPGSATNFTVYAYWTPTPFTLYYNANGGYVSASGKTLIFGNSLGSLPTPTRDYHNFIGWYDANGNPVYDSTVPGSATDLTIYAYWAEKDLDWASASDVPADAQIVDRKYTYTQTYYTTSSSSSLSGWIYYNTTSAWSDYGAWSEWQDGAISASDSRQVETQQVISGYEKKTQYSYSRYYGKGSDGYYYACAYKSGVCVTYEESGWLDYSLKKQETHSFGGKNYAAYGYNQLTGKDIYWYNQATREVDDTSKPIYVNQYRYRDRSLIYTYYFYRTENLESTSYPSGSDVSNVQEWVCYRPK
ncbi:MAG: InlB B-repeat-containing protein [Clostridia bacterium]|nr:InlB B-repeat-containing protein [Clostridia bacterium]